MSSVAEIKAAAARLSSNERLELFRWLAEREDIVRQQADLLADIDAGLAEADRGNLLPGEEIMARLKARARGAA